MTQIPRLQTTFQPYVAKHADALWRLEQLDAQLDDYIQMARSLSRHLTSAWNLDALLIKPVQRILKYPLLVEAILNHTPRTHPDFDRLLAAHARLIQLAQTFNEAKRSHEIVTDVLVRSRIKTSRSDVSSSSVQTARKMAKSPSLNLISTPKFSKAFGKTIGRTHQRLKSAVGLRSPTSPNSLSDEDLLHALEVRLEQQRAHITALEDSFGEFVGCTRAALEALRRLLAAWIETMETVPGTSARYGGLDAMLEYLELVKTIQDGPWKDLGLHAREKFPLLVGRVLSAFQGPMAVLQKRKTKILDMQRQGKEARRSPDAGSYAEEVRCLTQVLLAELPAFLEFTCKALDRLVMEVARLQSLYSLRVFGLQSNFQRQYFEDLDTGQIKRNLIVKQFWDRHRPVLDTLDGFRIISGGACLGTGSKPPDVCIARIDHTTASVPPRRLSLPDPISSPRSLMGMTLSSPDRRRFTYGPSTTMSPISPVERAQRASSISAADTLDSSTVSSRRPSTQASSILEEPIQEQEERPILFTAIALSDIETRDRRMLSTSAGEELFVIDEAGHIGCFLARKADGCEGFIKQCDVVCFR